jgi:hypothetical protein
VGEHDDPIPALLAQIDQTLAVMPQMARLLHGYQEALEEAGVDRDVVIPLMVDYQRVLLSGGDE